MSVRAKDDEKKQKVTKSTKEAKKATAKKTVTKKSAKENCQAFTEKDLLCYYT